MFSLNEFVMKTIKSMVGNEPEYKIMKYSLGWYDKEVLTDDDMAAISNMLEPQPQNETEEMEEI